MLKLSVDDIYSIGTPGDLVSISYGAGNTYYWDGKNAQGELVGSGVYEIQVQAFFINSESVTVSKSVSILNGSANNLISGQKAYPNPFIMATAAGRGGDDKYQDIQHCGRTGKGNHDRARGRQRYMGRFISAGNPGCQRIVYNSP